MEDQVIAKFHPHPLGFLGTYVVGALLMVSPFFLGPFISQINLGFDGLIYGALFIAGFFLIIVTEINRRVQTYSIMEAGIEYKYSLIARKTEFVEYASIEEIRAEQGIFQRIFGIGTIIIETAGEASMGMTIPNAPEPHVIEKIVRDHMREVPHRI